MNGGRDVLFFLVATVAALLVGRGVIRKTQTSSAAPVSRPSVSDSVAGQVAQVERGAGVSPRGIRNNNPGNIRWDGKTNWRGMVAADPMGFVIFDTPEHGIRAMSRILNSYEGRGIITLDQIINTWAPPVENKTGAYVTHLAGLLGIAPNDRVTDRAGLIAGIIKHENGQQPYSMATIKQGVSLA